MITFFRLLLIPVFVGLFVKGNFGTALGIYITIELLDQLDGKIASLFGAKTDTGKFFDPFVDSLIHMTAFTCLFSKETFTVWILLIFIWREFGLIFLRLLGLLVNQPVGSLYAGKIKALIHAATIAWLLWDIYNTGGANNIFSQVLIILAVAASVISGIWYIVRFRGVLKKAFI